MSFNSFLGAIELGAWELGEVTSLGITTGAFTATANPSVALSPIGGVQNPFTSVTGTIRLGLFQLGQTPAGSVTSGETNGKGSFQGQAFPDVLAIPNRNLTGAFTVSAFPDAVAAGNKGPLLVVFAAFPDVATEGIFYYADGDFTCAPFPDVTVQGVATGGVVFSAFPDVILSPLVGQQFSCIVGPGTPEGIVENYAY